MSWAKDRHNTGQYNSLVGTVEDWISLGSCSNQLLFGGSPVHPLASAVLFHFGHLVTRSNNPNRGKQTSPSQPDLWYTGGTDQYCCSGCLEKYLQGWTTIMISIQENTAGQWERSRWWWALLMLQSQHVSGTLNTTFTGSLPLLILH